MKINSDLFTDINLDPDKQVLSIITGDDPKSAHALLLSKIEGLELKDLEPGSREIIVSGKDNVKKVITYFSENNLLNEDDKKQILQTLKNKNKAKDSSSSSSDYKTSPSKKSDSTDSLSTIPLSNTPSVSSNKSSTSQIQSKNQKSSFSSPSAFFSSVRNFLSGSTESSQDEKITSANDYIESLNNDIEKYKNKLFDLYKNLFDSDDYKKYYEVEVLKDNSERKIKLNFLWYTASRDTKNKVISVNKKDRIDRIFELTVLTDNIKPDESDRDAKFIAKRISGYTYKQANSDFYVPLQTHAREYLQLKKTNKNNPILNFARTTVSAQIEAQKSRVDELKSKKYMAQSRLEAKNKKISELENEIQDISDKITEFDTELSIIEQQTKQQNNLLKVGLGNA